MFFNFADSLYFVDEARILARPSICTYCCTMPVQTIPSVVVCCDTTVQTVICSALIFNSLNIFCSAKFAPGGKGKPVYKIALLLQGIPNLSPPVLQLV